MLGLLDDGGRPVFAVELDDAVPLRIGDVIGEDDRRLGDGRRLQPFAQLGAEEDVVTEHEGDPLSGDELLADDERLRETLGAGLLGIDEATAPPGAVAEHALETRQVLGSADHEDLADAGRHQRRERVVDHRLVVDGKQLLPDRRRHGSQARARTAREHYPSHPHPR